SATCSLSRSMASGLPSRSSKPIETKSKKSSARCCGPIATSSIIRRARSRSYPSGDERNRKWQKMRITITHRITAEIFWSRDRRWRTSSKARVGMSSPRTTSPSMKFLTSVWCGRYLKKWGNRRVDGYAIEQSRSTFSEILFLFGDRSCLRFDAGAAGANRQRKNRIFDSEQKHRCHRSLYCEGKGFFS